MPYQYDHRGKKKWVRSPEDWPRVPFFDHWDLPDGGHPSFSFRLSGAGSRSFVSILKKFQKEGMVVAEVGTYDGNTTCLALPVVESCNGKYIAIDWFKGTKNPNWKNIDHPHYYDPSQAEDTYQRFINNIKAGGWENICRVIKGDSVDAASLIADRTLDVLFIDADHRYSKVAKDIELYLPKLKDGGVIVVDDCERLGIINDSPEALSEIRRASNNTVGSGLLMEDDSGSGTGVPVHWGVVQAVCDVFDHNVNIEFVKHGNSIAWQVINDKEMTNENYLRIRKLLN